MPNSRAWLRRHHTDPFVKAAKQQGYASRAAFKLIEIQKKDKLFKSGMTVIDLGAAPGGWSQVASQFIGAQGKIIAVDTPENIQNSTNPILKQFITGSAQGPIQMKVRAFT